MEQVPPGAGLAMRSGFEGAAAWASALQAVASLVAHDFRNALNAVAVNLEVVHGRSARGADAAAIAPFAATARAQFEAVSAAAEALLVLSRPAPGRADVVAVADSLARLLALRGDGAVQLTRFGAGAAFTAVPPDVVRAVVARGVLSALAGGPPAACEITVGDGIFLRVSGAANASPSLDPDLVAVASTYAVAVATRGHVLEIRFPTLGTDATPDAAE